MRLAIEVSEKLHERRHEAGPARLVARADARAVVAVEVLIKEDVVDELRGQVPMGLVENLGH